MTLYQHLQILKSLLPEEVFHEIDRYHSAIASYFPLHAVDFGNDKVKEPQGTVVELFIKIVLLAYEYKYMDSKLKYAKYHIIKLKEQLDEIPSSEKTSCTMGRLRIKCERELLRSNTFEHEIVKYKIHKLGEDLVKSITDMYQRH